MKALISLVLIVTISTVLWFMTTHSSGPQLGTYWYQMVWQGDKVGYLRQDIQMNGEYLQVRNETQVETKSQGQPFSFQELQVLNFDKAPPHRLISGRYRYNAPQHFVETQLRATVAGLEGFRQVNHRREAILLEGTNYLLADHLPIPSWFEEQATPGSSISVSFPSFSDAEINETTYQFTETSDGINYVEYRHSECQSARQLEVDDDGHILAYRYGGIIELNQVDDPEMLQFVSMVDQYKSQLVMLDKPVGEAEEVIRMELKVLDDSLFDSLPQTNRQKLSSDILELNADIAVFQAQSTEKPHTPVPIPAHLRLRMVILAMSIVEGLDNDLEKLTAIRDYVANFIEDSARVATPDLEALLNEPAGDCTEHTLLFNILAQSLGYQARSVDGLVYLGDEIGGFGGHQWSEVKIGEFWVSFDATWNINSLTGTHIRLSQETATEFYRQLQRGDDIKLELLAVEHYTD